MPIFRLFVAFLLIAVAADARSFDVRRDTFAFANETAWAYEVDSAGQLHIGKRETAPVYAHSCFIMSRVVMQFWQFARFAPDQPKVSEKEYARLIRKLSRIPVWGRGPRERIVIPGYPNLHAFSRAYAPLLQKNMGKWQPTYLRVGNCRMALPHPRAGQAAAARWLTKSMGENRLRAVYLARFPSMNHIVVVYASEPRPNGDTRFWCYDPNYPEQRAWLDYSPRERSFSFEPRWYFPGGRVNVMRVYISPFH